MSSARTNTLQSCSSAGIPATRIEGSSISTRCGTPVSLSRSEKLRAQATVAEQEYLEYRLEWAPPAQSHARVELDALVAAELREPFAKPLLAIDLNRYVPWATRLVRKPFGESADDVRSAVRLIGLLKLESEREYLADASAVELTRNPAGLERALAKIASDQEVLEVANRATQHLYFTNPIKKFEDRSSGLFSTHPPIVERINRLRTLTGEGPLDQASIGALSGLD